MFLKVCLVLSLCSGAIGHDPSESYPNSVRMSPEFELYWKVAGNQITFEIHAKMPPGGWAGIGFSKNGTAMYPADIAMGFVDPTNTGHIEDAKTTRHGVPDMDKQQDLTLVKAVYEQGFLVVAFSRDLNTHDADDVAIQNGPMDLIWAYGSIDATSNLPAYHQTHRGAKTVTLIQPGTPVGK